MKAVIEWDAGESPTLEELWQAYTQYEGVEENPKAFNVLSRVGRRYHLVWFYSANFFDDGAGQHGELLDEIDGIDVPLSMHVYPFPQTDEWEGQWFFFDVQLHSYQLHISSSRFPLPPGAGCLLTKKI